MAFPKAVLTPSVLLLETSVSTFLMSVFSMLFTDLFLIVLFSVCLVRLMADSFFLTAGAGKVIPPFNYGFYSLC